MSANEDNSQQQLLPITTTATAGNSHTACSTTMTTTKEYYYPSDDEFICNHSKGDNPKNPFMLPLLLPLMQSLQQILLLQPLLHVSFPLHPMSATHALVIGVFINVTWLILSPPNVKN